jgi:hypothetical protein
MEQAERRRIDNNFELNLYYALPDAHELLDWLRMPDKYRERNPLPGLVQAHEVFWASSETAAFHYGQKRAAELQAVHFNINRIQRGRLFSRFLIRPKCASGRRSNQNENPRTRATHY